MGILFLTDLDGTLLCHDSFSFGSLHTALAGLKASGVEIVLASSKTEAEIHLLCEKLELQLPFIFENGAGFCANNDEKYPHHMRDFGTETPLILHKIDKSVPQKLRIKCRFLHQMSTAEQGKLLGLSEPALQDALSRKYSVLLSFEGTAKEFTELNFYLKEANLSAQRGGRVTSISGFHDKSEYISMLKKAVFKTGQSNHMVCFGDAANDLPMLNKADIACIIPNPKGAGITHDALKAPQMIFAKTPAPAGWLEAAQEAINCIST